MKIRVDSWIVSVFCRMDEQDRLGKKFVWNVSFGVTILEKAEFSVKDEQRKYSQKRNDI